MRVSCHNCGGNVIYIPEKKACYCSHCRKESNVNSVTVEKYVKNNKCVCSSCGATLITEQNTLITKCAYCGSDQIITTEFEGEFKPELVIPFKYGINSFVKIMFYSLHDRPLIPDDFIEKMKFKDIKGIYIPFRRYKIKSKNNVRGEGVKKVTSEGETYYYRNYFDYNYDFAGTVIFDTSVKVDNLDANSIGPFDFKEAISFNPAYLCDFSAKTGDDNLEERLAEELLIEMDGALKEQIGRFKFNAGVKNITYNAESAEDILLPVWVLDYHYKGANYRCLMNGQTGKVIGDLPVSKEKARRISFQKTIIPFLIISVIIYLTTRNLYLAVGAFAIMMIVMLIISPKVEEVKTNHENYSLANLNTGYVIRNADFKDISTKENYQDKYKDDLNVQSINISDGKKITYTKTIEKEYKFDENKSQQT